VKKHKFKLYPIIYWYY